MSWTGRFDRLAIGGEWGRPAAGGEIQGISPVTEQVVGTVREREGPTH